MDVFDKLHHQQLKNIELQGYLILYPSRSSGAIKKGEGSKKNKNASKTKYPHKYQNKN